jgi:hypothetical protein
MPLPVFCYFVAILDHENLGVAEAGFFPGVCSTSHSVSFRVPWPERRRVHDRHAGCMGHRHADFDEPA